MAQPRDNASQESPVLFIDRCLGSVIVAQALRGAGARVETHEDHFPRDCSDEEWIVRVSERGWVILTKDKAIRRRENEHEALQKAGAAAFILTSGDASGPEIAGAFISALPGMQRALQKYTRPLLATISRSGKVTIKKGTRRGAVRRHPRQP